MKKALLRALILGGLSLASVTGQSLHDKAFSLRNWGKSVYLDNLTSADDVLTLIADGTHLFRSLDLGKSWRAFPLPQDGAFGPFWQRVQFDPTAGLYYVTAVGAMHTAAPRASGWTRLFEGGPSFYSVDGETFAFNGWPNDGINVSRDGGRTWKYTDRFAANGGGGCWLMRVDASGTSMRSPGGRKVGIRRAPPYSGDFMERNRRMDGRWIRP